MVPWAGWKNLSLQESNFLVLIERYSKAFFAAESHADRWIIASNVANEVVLIISELQQISARELSYCLLALSVILVFAILFLAYSIAQRSRIAAENYKKSDDIDDEFEAEDETPTTQEKQYARIDPWNSADSVDSKTGLRRRV